MKASRRPLVLHCPTGSFELALDEPGVDLSALRKEANGPIFRKELAYQGTFRKMKEDGSEPEFELDITPELMNHWVQTFRQMKQNGVGVPMPIGHTSEPDRRRGTVYDLRVEPNPKRKGGMSLYAYCGFNDHDAAKQFKHSNVSLFMPPKQFDGKGRQYIRPVKHVAITDYPVIPGLDAFQQVAASFTNAFELSLSNEDDEMSLTWQDVADELGIEVPEGADEETAKAAVQDAVGGGSGPDDEGDDEGDDGIGDDDTDLLHDEEDEDEEASFEVPDDEFGADDGGDLVDDEGDDEMRTQGAPPAMSMEPTPVPLTVVKREAKNRRDELSSLVKSGRISPACAKVLEKKYCTDSHVGVALSLEPSLGCAGDDFDEVVAALSLIPEKSIASTGSKTGPQNHRADKSPIVLEAERRADKK